MATANSASSLYRSILRAHKRYLPPKMKDLGDTYVRNEFRLHKTAQPEQANQFFTAWESYLGQIVSAGRAREAASIGSLDASQRHQEMTGGGEAGVFQFGSSLPTEIQLSEDRKAQLLKLKSEIEKST